MIERLYHTSHALHKSATVKQQQKSTGKKRGPYFKSGLPTPDHCKLYAILEYVDRRPAEVLAVLMARNKKTIQRWLHELEEFGAIAQEPVRNIWIERLDTIQRASRAPRIIERPNPQFRKRKLWGAEIDLANDLRSIVRRSPHYATWANKTREQLIRRYVGIGWNVAPARNKRPIFTKAEWASKTTEQKLRWMLAHKELDVGMWIEDHVVYDFDHTSIMPDYQTLITKSPHGFHCYFWRTPETRAIYGLPRIGKDISVNMQLQGFTPDQIPDYCKADIDTRAFGDFVMLPPSRGYSWANLEAPAHLLHYHPELLEVWKHRWHWSDLLGRPIRPEGKFELPDEIPEGFRQEFLFKYGRSLRAKGKSFEVISNEIRLCNQERCKPPLDDQRELERTINWVMVYKNRRDFLPDKKQKTIDAQ